MSLDQIRQSIEARIAEAKTEIATLQAARAALNTASTTSGNGTAGAVAKAPLGRPAGAPADPPPRPRTRVARKPAPAPRRVEVLLAGKLEAMLRDAQEGLSASTISKRANAGYGQVRELLRELESAGQVRRTGTRRTSLWRLITEEEQIAERAAELAKLSRTASAGSPG